VTSVVFVHGLWIHSLAWQPWLDLFAERGYAPTAPGWPGDADTVAGTRARPDAVAGHGLDDITRGYAEIIDRLPDKPVVIGHSFGGLIAQKLLAQGRAAAAVAIDPAQIKGVKPVPFAQVRAGLPVLSRPGNRRRAVTLTEKQFAYGFGNALSPAESASLHQRWTIPGPGRPLFEATAANFSRTSPAAVDTGRGDRGPLLLIAGGRDHTVPEVVVRAAYKLYAGSGATTDYQVFPDRGHSLVFDQGWRQIADFTLAWLDRQTF
jgi:pimeloyl-ACP methyl ester carboxylesterase